MEPLGWRPILRKASAHGLGHLISPYTTKTAPRTIPRPEVPLHELGVERWQHDVWHRLAHALIHETELDLSALPHLDRPVMSGYTITTPGMKQWFETENRGRPYRQSIRPFGVFIAPTVTGLGRPLGKAQERFRLVAPYTTDPERWTARPCTDIYSDESFEISTTHYDATTAKVRTYRDIIAA